MISSDPKHMLAATLLIAGLFVAGCAPEKPSEARLRGDLDRTGEAKGNQRPTAEIEKEAVVTVDGEEISLGELNRRLQELPEFARARYSTTEQKQSYLDSVAQFELMADVAEQEGFGDRPEVRYALEAALAGRLVDEVTGEKLSMNDIEDEAIRRYYDSHLDAFRTDEARRVALIEIDSREEAERLREQVLGAMQDASDSPITAFRKQAAQHSVDRAVARKGGDVGFVERADAADTEANPVAEQVFSLEEAGEVTPVFEVDGGFALATFFEERKASVTSPEEASGEIRAKLYEQRKQQIERELIAELRESAQIEVDDEVVEAAEGAPEPSQRRVEDIEVSEVAPLVDSDMTGSDQSEDNQDAATSQ
jgi:hypothetical protein